MLYCIATVYLIFLVKIMTDITALQTSISQLTNALIVVQNKLTDIQTFIATLKAGTITQDQIDNLTQQVNEAVASTSVIEAREDLLAQGEV